MATLIPAADVFALLRRLTQYIEPKDLAGIWSDRGGPTIYIGTDYTEGEDVRHFVTLARLAADEPIEGEER